jgi:1-acyl-sn-glycerol-3-phosphate acyltransferase
MGNFWYAVFHHAVWLFLHLFYRVRVIGGALPEGGAIICANHSSNWDVVFLACAFGSRTPLIFTPKHTMRRIPLLGPGMNLIRVIWIDRTKPGDPAPIRKMIAAVRDEGGKLVLFPEGRRVQSDDAESAKTGAIMIATRTGAPIVPVYIPRRKRLLRTITVAVGEPYTVKHAPGTVGRRVAADELMSKIAALGESV